MLNIFTQARNILLLSMVADDEPPRHLVYLYPITLFLMTPTLRNGQVLSRSAVLASMVAKALKGPWRVYGNDITSLPRLRPI